jgi:hypothetical protein
VTDTARVLFTAAILAASAISMFAWRVRQIDAEQPGRLIGELRLAQWAALILAGVGTVPIGLALAHPTISTAHLDATLGLIFVLIAGLVLQRDPREALLLVAGGFVLHALANLTHRPGWLPVEIAPRWYTVGCSTFDVYLAALCYWARSRS